ncbi:MAG TPA: ChbG/HpnK family deacetylase [Candidatus Binatia bacterium]|nr:ChbG/HpnK family deacetylase [Candidatus Binatia bacterium]
MTARRLIVSADDFGLGPAVDRGIAAAVETGAVTSVGVMASLVNGAALRALPSGISLGVHLNLTTGAPLSPSATVPSLVDAKGEFLPLATLARRALTGRVRTRDVERELGAQLARMRALGATIDHVDSHEHVHLLPGVMGAAVRATRAAGVRRIRSHRPRLMAATGSAMVAYYRAHPRRVLTHAAKHLLALRLRHAGLAMPDGMVAPSLLAAPVAGGPLRQWEAIAAALPAGTWELVVHPADLGQIGTAAERDRLGELVESRGAELAALTAPEFHRMVRAHGVELVPFAAVPDADARRPAPVLRHA